MRSLICGDTFPRLWEDMRAQPGKWLSRLVYLLGPWFCFAFVEIMNGNTFAKDFEAWQVLFNLIWYYILFFLARLLLGRRRAAGAVCSLLLFAVGLLNHYILRFRGRIIFPADLAAWRTAANVAEGFDYSPDVQIRQALIVLIAYLFLLAVCPGQKKRDRAPLAAALGLLLTGAYVYAFFFTGMLPAMQIYTQQWNTRHNGFLLNFTVAARYGRTQRPAGYSPAAAEVLAARFPALAAPEGVTRPANVIVVMNEAFSDLTIFDALEPSDDPTPFLHSLHENTICGFAYPPVTGGGTASTEFEFLTGFSNSFLPPHSVAYQLYVNQNTPSFSAVMGSLGYSTAAFHPYQSSGWNRPIVYQSFKFDRQLYDKDVVSPKYVRRYISDESDYETLAALTDASEGKPQFIFNVTMQNHSGFAQGWNRLTAAVVPGAAALEADPAAKQYLSLMRCSDEALRGLIGHYRQVEEPTLIVFFGDHQPSLKNKFYEVMYGKSLEDRTTEEVLMQYAVPFFLWANYDIPEQEGLHVSTNYLSMLTARTAGLPMTGWMNFLSQFYDQLPVVTPVGYMTPEGTAVTREELTEEQRSWLKDYETLCYCGLMDRAAPARDFFLKTE